MNSLIWCCKYKEKSNKKCFLLRTFACSKTKYTVDEQLLSVKNIITMCNQPHTSKSFASLQPDAFDAVIVAGGDFPTHSVPLAVIEHARMLVACDSAGEELVRRGFKPTAIVGDCDSMSAEFRAEHADLINKVEEQDYNDLTKATRFCIGRGCRRIAYVGATGKREDHTLGNISLIDFYRRELHVDAVMLTDYGVFLAASGETTIATFAGQQISIFNLTCTQLDGDGLRWQPYAFSALWQGTLNEALGESVTLRGDGSYIVYAVYKS